MFRCMDAATRKCYSQRGGRPGAFGARASAVGAKSGRNCICVSSGWVVTRVLCLLWTGVVKAENRSGEGVCLLWMGRGEAADGSDGGVCLLWTGRGEAENRPVQSSA